MMQIRSDRIRPHRRVLIPLEPSDEVKSAEAKAEERSSPKPIRYAVGWDIPEEHAVVIDPPLSGWFSGRVSVRGESLTVEIDGRTLFHAESFVKNPAGKVGFRNAGAEKALIRNVRVILHT